MDRPKLPVRRAVLLLCASFLCGEATASATLGTPSRLDTAGCGLAANNPGRFVTIRIRVHGSDRTYRVWTPRKYDPNRPYPLIFRWHGRGGDGLSGGLDIESRVGDGAIVVGADGLNGTWSRKERAGDLAFFDAMLAGIERNYCVDRDRVFSYGDLPPSNSASLNLVESAF